MIPTPSAPKYAPGTRVRVVQRVRVGSNEWRTEVSGVVEREGVRSVGGMEMGGKGSFGRQPTLRLRKESGEITVVAVDEHTEIQVVEA